MTIRRATEQDARRIKDIAEKLRLDPNNPSSNGFLVYMLTEQEYQQRIRDNPYFFVSEYESNVNGFFMAYDHERLRQLIDSHQMGHLDGYVKFLLNQQPPFLIGDQIAVDPELYGTGNGLLLMNRAFTEMRSKGIPTMYIDILQSPIKNQRSIDFCTAFGFKKISEVTNKDGFIWGAYKREV